MGTLLSARRIAELDRLDKGGQMAHEAQDNKLAKTDVTPGEKIPEDTDDILHDAVRGVPANKESMADEQQDLATAEDESLLDEITRVSNESSAAAGPAGQDPRSK